MNKRGHFNGATVTLGLSFALVEPNIKTGVIMSICIITGAFLPDFDADHSYIRYLLKPVAKVYDLLPKNALFKHRGLFLHSIWTVLILGVISYYFNQSWLIWLIIGVLSHHILDAVTPMGLKKYFYPIVK